MSVEEPRRPPRTDSVEKMRRKLLKEWAEPLDRELERRGWRNPDKFGEYE